MTMEKRKSVPTVHVVYDFRHRAGKTKKGVVDVCVTYCGKRKYISTGVKVFPSEWDRRDCAVRNRLDAEELNARVAAVRSRVNGYVSGCIGGGSAFSLDELAHHVGAVKEAGSFVDFVGAEIEADNGIAATTKRAYRELVPRLREFGGIVSFGDVTTANVLAFVNWLKGRGYMQQTVHTAYKTLRRYVNVARVRGLVEGDPLLGVKVQRGQSEQGRWLSEGELSAIETAKVLPPLDKVRDVFLVQCYTGLAYSDLAAVCAANVQDEEGMPVLTGCRRKTGQPFAIPLLPGCVEILERYGWRLPLMSLEQYNMRLKAVADICGIDKPVASHWGRRTCGTMLLNKGVPIEIVAKILGHSNIRITQQCYAKILNKTVVAAMKRIAAK